MNAIKTLLAGAALAVSAVGANAATFYADKVVDSSLGTCTVCDANRQNPNAALGASDNKFYSLGFGGTLTVGFSRPVFQANSSVTVFEITYRRDIGHDEAVDVYSVLGGVETYLGQLLNNVASSSVLATTAFEYIKLVDVTKTVFPGNHPTRSGDGFDVDSVSVAAVPLPAAGLLLLGGLGGLAALRRRKKLA